MSCDAFLRRPPDDRRREFTVTSAVAIVRIQSISQRRQSTKNYNLIKRDYWILNQFYFLLFYDEVWKLGSLIEFDPVLYRPSRRIRTGVGKASVFLKSLFNAAQSFIQTSSQKSSKRNNKNARRSALAWRSSLLGHDSLSCALFLTRAEMSTG